MLYLGRIRDGGRPSVEIRQGWETRAVSWWMSELGWRILIFPTLMLVLAVWEALLPRRRWQLAKPWRWISNLGLALLNNVVLRVLAPLGLAGIALWAEELHLGLLRYFDLPEIVSIPLTVVLLDLVVYTQHVLFHRVPILWRLHLVHHADLDFDFTTGVRFHTLEILLSFGIKVAAVILLSGAVLGVVIFELLLTATSLFNHANIRLPARIEQWLRLVVVTPEMHRIHHSAVVQELNSNYGFNLPWWDFLFRTYRPEPRDGQEKMLIGLSWLREERQANRLPSMLALPFLVRLPQQNQHV